MGKDNCYILCIEYCEGGELLKHTTDEHRKAYLRYNAIVDQLRWCIDMQNQIIERCRGEYDLYVVRDLEQDWHKVTKRFDRCQRELGRTHPNIEYIMKVQRQFAQLVQCIAKMHGQGILHLDISPENILLDNNGNVKLCDFGRSEDFTNRRQIHDFDPNTRSIVSKWDFRVKKSMGKSRYMSPEVCLCYCVLSTLLDLFYRRMLS